MPSNKSSMNGKSDRLAERAARAEHVVPEDHALFDERHRDLRGAYDRLLGDRLEVVPVERDVQCTKGNFDTLDLLEIRSYPLRDIHSASANPDDDDLVETLVTFDDFMRNPFDRAAYLVLVHDCGFCLESQCGSSDLGDC